MSAEVVPVIDWGPVDRIGVPEDTVTCRCGAVYRSHVKVALIAKSDDHPHGIATVSRRPCPDCGFRCNARSVSSEWETWSL